MRTLEEMKHDLEKIEQNLKIISEIASLARPYTYVDLTAWKHQKTKSPASTPIRDKSYHA